MKKEAKKYVVGKLLNKISKEKILAKGWKCVYCGMIFIGNGKVINPAPCIKCKGEIFVAIMEGTKLYNISVGVN